MARLNEPIRKGFAPHDFEQFPVWVWDDEMEGHLPLEESQPSPEEYGTLFIRAKVLAGDRQFDGYLIGGASFFGFGILAADREFVFNIRLPELNRMLVTELALATRDEALSFSSISYSSDVKLANGLVIEGSLSI
jgi:hypothetical protein